MIKYSPSIQAQKDHELRKTLLRLWDEMERKAAPAFWDKLFKDLAKQFQEDDNI